MLRAAASIENQVAYSGRQGFTGTSGSLGLQSPSLALTGIIVHTDGKLSLKLHMYIYAENNVYYNFIPR